MTAGRRHKAAVAPARCLAAGRKRRFLQADPLQIGHPDIGPAIEEILVVELAETFRIARLRPPVTIARRDANLVERGVRRTIGIDGRHAVIAALCHGGACERREGQNR